MERSGKRQRICENDGIARGTSGTQTSTEGDRPATLPRCDYEVFLSFRGPVIRAGFADFLYASMKDAQIRVFKDDEDLPTGEEFPSELLQAIDQARISIPIFSKGYASSIWCLKELVQMVESKKNRGQKIMPIFYDVAPSEVRHQTGIYGEAFLSHEKKNRYDEQTMLEWKAALKEVSFLNGWDLHNMPNRREGEFARKVTQKIFNILKKAYLVVSDCLVSVDNHVDAITKMIVVQTSETRIIGIHGMGGIGKTTIAKIIYNRLLHDFENCCFLSDIREMSKRNGIPCLQNQLISDILKTKCTDIKSIDEGTQTIKERLSNKRVLLLLDDVEEENHMNYLVGKRDWFGKGSILIITTRKRDVLKVTEVDGIYEVDGMDNHQSLQLFSKHAFRMDYPPDKYINQSERAMKIAGGLPLSLEVIGSLLSRIEKEKWDVKLEKFEGFPPKDVLNKLRISYDTLEVHEKHIFLDIACLFAGHDKKSLVHFWKSKFHPEDTMDVLENMSLIKIKEDDIVWMHDQFRDLGRHLVREESSMKMRKQTRVWDPEEALDLLRSEGKKEVEGLDLQFDNEGHCRVTFEGFMGLSNLRFLRINGSMEDFSAEESLLWHESPSLVLPTNVSPENAVLLPQLRWLSWCDIPPTFKITSFFMEDVVILDLSESKITDDWKGWSHMKVMKNLKILNLSYCKHLMRTPNFSTHLNLERLILSGCGSLTEIDRSICQLKLLVSLDISFCENLSRLPDELGQDLASLEYLSMRYCKSLKRLPDTIGDLESLIELDISHTRIKELPDTVGKLKNLRVVKMLDGHINSIPDAFWTIEKLEKIEVSVGYGTKNFQVKIGDCLYKNQCLKILKLRGLDIYALPPRLPETLIKLQLCTLYMDKVPDLSNLTNLKKLDLSWGTRFDGVRVSRWDPIPGWIGNLTKLESLSLSCYILGTASSPSPTDVCLPPQLKSLRLNNRNLCRLPRLPSSLSSLRLDCCSSLCSMGDLSNLKDLSSLYISSAAIAEIQGLGFLEKLRDLELWSLQQVEILPDLSNLNKLRSLKVWGCHNLIEIQGKFPLFLDRLHISMCPLLQKLPDLSSLMGKQAVIVNNCNKLNVEVILVFAQMNQRDLQIVGLNQLQVLPDLSNLNELRCLVVENCENLVEIQGELPQSLEELKISSCELLQKLPDFSSLKGLRSVRISHCGKLNAEAILGFAQKNPRELQLVGFEQLQLLQNLSGSDRLRHLRVGNCTNLVEIQGDLPQSLKEFKISSCESLHKLPDLSSLKKLQRVDIEGCTKLKGEAILGSTWRSQANLWENLRYLRICDLGQVKILPDLSNLNKLRRLYIERCGDLVEIQGELPQSLKELKISSCKSLQKLPDLSSLKGLQRLEIDHCGKLNVEANSWLCSEKLVKFVVEYHESEFISESEYEGEDSE